MRGREYRVKIENRDSVICWRTINICHALDSGFAIIGMCVRRNEGRKITIKTYGAINSALFAEGRALLIQ